MSLHIRREVVGWERRRPHLSDGADAVTTTPRCEAHAQMMSVGHHVARIVCIASVNLIIVSHNGKGYEAN